MKIFIIIIFIYNFNLLFSLDMKNSDILNYIEKSIYIKDYTEIIKLSENLFSQIRCGNIEEDEKIAYLNILEKLIKIEEPNNYDEQIITNLKKIKTYCLFYISYLSSDYSKYLLSEILSNKLNNLSHKEIYVIFCSLIYANKEYYLSKKEINTHVLKNIVFFYNNLNTVNKEFILKEIDLFLLLIKSYCKNFTLDELKSLQVLDIFADLLNNISIYFKNPRFMRDKIYSVYMNIIS